MSERDFDFFDELVPGSDSSQKSEQAKPKEELDKNFAKLDLKGEVMTSYLLVNALLNLLIAKGVIYPHEVNSLLTELYSQYKKTKEE